MAAARRAMKGVKPTFDYPARPPCWAECALNVAKRCPARPRPATTICLSPLVGGLAGGAVSKGWIRDLGLGS